MVALSTAYCISFLGLVLLLTSPCHLAFGFRLPTQIMRSRKTETLLSSQEISPISSGEDMSRRRRSTWKVGDALDKKIFSLAAPAVVSFAILPLASSISTFWVGQMRNALALAAQGAAMQVHYSIFWIISFLPQVVTPLVAKAAGSGDKEALQESIRDSFFLGGILGLLGTVLLACFPSYAMKSVLPIGSAARVYAEPYLLIRILTFLPSMLSNICFAALRGSLDAITPLTVSLISNLVSMLLDPLLIFNAGMGVVGAAAATTIGELLAFALYARYLTKRGMIRWRKLFRPPSFSALKPLLVGGLGVQARAVFTHMAFLVATRNTQVVDATGTVAAAHSVCLQLWQLGAIFLASFGAVASIIVPNEQAKATRDGGKLAGLYAAQTTANRMLAWGAILGVILSAAQFACLPLLNVFSPLPEVQAAAVYPAIICASMQLLNFPMYIGEGIQQGNQYFPQLAVTTAIASAGMLGCLKVFGNTLPGIWSSFVVFNFVRLLGVLYHHYYDGPLAPRNILLVAAEVEKDAEKEVEKEEVKEASEGNKQEEEEIKGRI